MKLKKIIAVIIVASVFSSSAYISCFSENLKTSESETYSELVYNMNSEFRPGSLSSVEDITKLPLKRLIVKTNSNEPLENDYGAIDKIEGYYFLHILQYETAEQADVAYNQLIKEDVEFVDYDSWLFLDEYVPDNDNSSLVFPFSGNPLNWNSESVKADKAFQLINSCGINCNPVRVAVIDSGIYANHESFEPKDSEQCRIKTDPLHEFVYLGTPYPSDEDDYYHGTAVASVIYNNTMNNVEIYSYRIFMSTDTVITASVFDAVIRCAIDNDIDVINMSFRKSPYKEDRDNNTIKNVVNYAIYNNVVLVAATGNDCASADNLMPAMYDSVISVSASKQDNLPDTSYSNYGDCVDISAPGTDIYCASPRGYSDGNTCSAYNAYITASGTSFAAPLVSAAAATLKSIYPNMSPALVEEIIKESAYVPDNWAESCGEKNYGVGIIDFYNMLMVAKEKMKPQIFFNSANKFEIKSLEPSHTIYYTLDGSEPTPENGVLYTEPLDLSKKVINVIKAASFMGDAQVSETTVYRMTSFKDMKINRGETEKAVSDSYRGKIRWRSDNLAVATVDSEGNVTGVSEGKTNVVATLESGKRIIFNVTVKEQPLYWLIELFEFWLSLFGINI